MNRRDITVRLAVHPDGTTDRDEAVAAIKGRHRISVATDEIAYDVLIALGADPIDARRSIRMSYGVPSSELESREMPSLDRPPPASTNIAMPDGWSAMTTAEKDEFVGAALRRLAIAHGVIADDPNPDPKHPPPN